MPGYSISGIGTSGFTAQVDLESAAAMQHNMELLQTYAPRFVGGDPQAAIQMAQRYQSDDELLRAAWETTNFVDLEEKRDTLEQSPKDYAEAAFQTLPKTVQRQLREAGYKPPSEDDDGGFFGIDVDIDGPMSVVGAVGSVLRQGASLALPDMVGDTLNTVLGGIPRQIQRVYRTAAYSSDRAGGGFFDFGDIGAAWRAVEDGDETFYKQYEDRASEILMADEDKMNVARKVAGGHSVEEIAKDAGFQENTPEFFEEVLRLYSLSAEDDVVAAVDQLKMGKMSVGRFVGNLYNLVTPHGVDYRGWDYDLFSGAIDAGVQFIDPTLIAGWGARTVNAGRYGLTAVRAADEINDFRKLDKLIEAGGKFDGPAIKGFDRFVAHNQRARGVAISNTRKVVNEIFSEVEPAKRFQALNARLPQFKPAWNDMRTFQEARKQLGQPGLETLDGYWDFLATTEGVKAIRTTKLGGYGRVKNMVPHTTRKDLVVGNLKTVGREKVVDLTVSDRRVKELIKGVEDEKFDLKWSEDALKVLRDAERKVDERMARRFAPARQAGRALARPGAAFVRSLIEHVPENRWVDFADPHANEEFARLAETIGVLAEIPHELVDHYISRFSGDVSTFGANITNDGVRTQTAREMMHNFLRIAGADDEVVQRWSGLQHGYAIDPKRGLIDAGGNQLQGALLPYSGTAGGLAIPNIKHLIPQFRNRAILNHTLGATPVRWADRMVGKYWTPAVLMRLSFIPRAFGEEALQLFLSESKRTFAEEKIAQWARYDDEVLGGHIFFRNNKAKDLINADKQSRALMRAMGLDVEASSWLGMSDDLYAQLNDLESYATRWMTHIFHSGTRRVVEWLDEASPMGRKLTELDRWGQYRAAVNADIIKAGVLAPVRGARKALLEAGKHSPLYDAERVEFESLMAQSEFLGQLRKDLEATTNMLQDLDYRDMHSVLESTKIHMIGEGGEATEVTDVLQKSNITSYSNMHPFFKEFTFRHMRRHAQDDIGIAGVRVLESFIDETTLRDMHTLLKNHKFSTVGGDPIEDLNNVRLLIEKMPPKVRTMVRRGLADDEDAYEAAIKRLSGSKRPEYKQFAKLMEAVDNKPGLRAKLRSQSSRDVWTGTTEDLQKQIAATLKRHGYKPQHTKKMRSLVTTNAGQGRQAAINRIPDGFSPVYIPLVDEAALDAISGIDPAQMRAVLSRHLGLRSVDPALADKVLDALDELPNLMDEAELSRGVAEARTWRDMPFVPGFNWGTSNPDVARAVSSAVNEIIGSPSRTPLVGQRFIPDADLAKSSAAGDGWRLTDGGTGVRSSTPTYKDGSFFLDNDQLAQLRLLDPEDSVKVHRIQQFDGTTELIDEGHLAAVRADIERRVAEMPARKRMASKELKRAAKDAHDEVYGQFDALFGASGTSLRRPPPRDLAGGEWDWFYALDKTEQMHIRKTWMMKEGGDGPDVLAHYAGLSVDEAMGEWLRLKIQMMNLGALASGRETKLFARYGGVADLLAPHVDGEFINLDEVYALRNADEAGYRALLEDELLPEVVDTFEMSGVSVETLMDDWADRLAADQIDTFVAPSGRVIDEIVERIASNPRGFTFEHMLATPAADFAPVVKGEVIGVDVPTDWWSKFTRDWFDGIVGPAGAAISRNQRFHRVAFDAWKNVKPMIDDVFIDKELEELVGITANKLGVSDAELLAGWKQLGEEMRENVDLKPEDLSDLFVRRILGVEDPALTRKFIDKNGKQWGPVISPNGNFDGKMYGLLQQARRAGVEPPFEKALTGEEFADIRRWAKMRQIHEETLMEAVQTAAWKDVAPFIDDRRFRSLFQEIVGNLIPFQFAEEQFVKRWLRTMQQTPEAIFQAMLMMNGFRKVGWIKTDPQSGEEYYIYPGSAQMTWAFAKGVNVVFGREVITPVAAPLTGRVQYSMPGLDGSTPGLPNPGPLFGVAIDGLGSMFPELKPGLELVGGSQVGSRSISSYFVPASIRNIYETVSGDDEELASATIEAMAFLEATGDGLPEEAGPAAIDAYQQKVRNHARIMLGMRAVIGFTGPSSAQRLQPGHVFADDLARLMKSGVPPQDALAAFVKKYKDDGIDVTPFTVFKSESTSEAYLPQTQAAFDFMTENKTYLQSFPQAGPWLLPGAEEGDEAVRAAYYEQLGNGMRKQLGIEEWYDKMRFRQGAKEYFDSKNRLDEQLLIYADDPQMKRALNESFDTWKEAYFKTHPLFAEQLNSVENQRNRLQTLSEMELILADSDAPQAAMLAPLRTLFESFRRYQTTYRGLGDSRAGNVEDAKVNTKISFMNWAEMYIHQHPEVRDFYRSIIEPEIRASYAQQQMVSA